MHQVLVYSDSLSWGIIPMTTLAACIANLPVLS
jgi:hypothetical protein